MTLLLCVPSTSPGKLNGKTSKCRHFSPRESLTQVHTCLETWPSSFQIWREELRKWQTVFPSSPVAAELMQWTESGWLVHRTQNTGTECWMSDDIFQISSGEDSWSCLTSGSGFLFRSVLGSTWHRGSILLPSKLGTWSAFPRFATLVFGNSCASCH